MNRKRCLISLPCILRGATGAVMWLLLAGLASAQSWPADVAGHKPVQPGEHPRLFFRKADLPALKQKAQTPEGQVIIARLKFLLNGGDGASLPELYNPNKGKQAADGAGNPVSNAPEGKAFTLWHATGYGMLFQLTGDKRYADLGRQCLEKMVREQQRDRDNRYAFRAAHGALRAGPSLGAVAMGYDLLYDGLDPKFREEVALAMQNYNEGPNMSLAELARGARHGPHSNHYGPQVGGAALALLAIMGDPGVDNAKVKELLDVNTKAMIRAVTEGSGDGGMFWEGKGPGGINTDTALVPAFQAWLVAGGKDFVSPRPNVTAINVIKLHELVVIKGTPWYPIPKPSSYGTGEFTPKGDRGGLSRGGQFAQGFGIMPEKLKPAMLWVYNNIVERDPAKRTFDTVGWNPHRPVLALINWPIGMKEQNPAEVLPKVHWDNERVHYNFRNQWTGTDDDIIVNATFGARDPHALMIWGKGQKMNLFSLPRGKQTHFQPAEDGSGTVTVGKVALGVDFSKASGADALVVVAGGDGKSGQVVKAGVATLQIFTVGGKTPNAEAQGDKVVVGGQTISYDGEKIVFGKMAGPLKLPRCGLWK
jgi:hypothetical protein